MVIRAGCVAGLRGRAADFFPRAPAGRGLARAWRVANLAAGQEKPPPIRAGGCEHAGEGLVWLLGGPYDGHAGGLGSCCLIAVDVGAEGRGPFRGAFFLV